MNSILQSDITHHHHHGACSGGAYGGDASSLHHRQSCHLPAMLIMINQIETNNQT